MKKVILACIGILLLFSGTGSAAVDSGEKTPKKEKTPAAGASIVVTVSVENPSGSTTLPKDVEVFLCPPSVKPEMAKVRATGKMLAQQAGDFNALGSDLVFLTGRAGEKKVQSVLTDDRGKGTLTDVKKGTYVLYAGYKNDFCAGYWIVPVTVSGTKQITITLTKKNMEEFLKKN